MHAPFGVEWAAKLAHEVVREQDVPRVVAGAQRSAFDAFPLKASDAALVT